MKIDLHTHILPRDWPNLRERYGYGGFVQLEHHGPGCARMTINGQLFREVHDNCWDPRRRLEDCDRFGVAMQVLSTVPVMFSYWAKPEDGYDLARLLNDHLAEVVRTYPTRFAGLGTLPLQAPDLAVRELERCVGPLGLRGVQIGSHVNGMNLDHPSLFPIFEAAERLEAAVFVHPWDMLGKDRMSNYWLGWLVGMPAETALAICSVIFGGVLERLPRLRIAFAHGGGSFPGILGRIEAGFRSRPDLVAVNNPRNPREYLGRFYLDSLVHDADALRRLLQLVGPNRIALGTDYPFPLGEQEPGRLIESLGELSTAVKQRLLAGTALEFLGLDAAAAGMAAREGTPWTKGPGVGTKGIDLAAAKFEPDEAFARRLDAEDPLRGYRDRFLLPRREDGAPLVYLCGHSLGLQPAAARAIVRQELDDWARLGVDAHFRGTTPWYSYHETLREAGARLVGALPHEVVFMNSLTVNLHLLLATFFRPAGVRRCILTDEPAFPSDLYALQSHLHHRGLDAGKCLLRIGPRPGEHLVCLEDVDAALNDHGPEIAVVWWNAVNFLTGQAFDVPQLTAAAHQQGCLIGLDLAHAAGNVPLHLHEWGVDFAVWCSYKYLNGGPGAVGGCFIHERHGKNVDLPRLAGWWGNDPATRFRMQLEPRFVPREGADGWQISNPPILSLAPLRASLALFDEVGMPALRAKSEKLTAYLLFLLDRLPAGRFEVITPRDPCRRGSQISLLVRDRPRELVQALEQVGIVCDFREPNMVRLALSPLYNSYHDAWSFAVGVSRQLMEEGSGSALNG